MTTKSVPDIGPASLVEMLARSNQSEIHDIGSVAALALADVQAHAVVEWLKEIRAEFGQVSIDTLIEALGYVGVASMAIEKHLASDC